VKNSYLLALLCAFLASTLSEPLYATAYTIIDLGTLGGLDSEGHDLNNSRQVSGYSATTGNLSGHAFIYENSSMRDIGTLGGSSFGWSINGDGQIAGTYKSGSINRGFLYDGNILQDIGTLGGTATNAFDINDYGNIVGGSHISGNTATHAFLYENGVMQDLGTLGGDDSQAYGINNKGQITGSSRIIGNTTNAFIYENGTMHDIGTLGDSEATGLAINNNGHVTGYSNLLNLDYQHAFFYDGNSMIDIGTLGGRRSSGNDINDSDQIVGVSLNSSNEGRAFLYDHGTMLDLCVITGCVLAGWDFLQDANAINNNGDITGRGYINGKYHAFLITTVPLPSTLWLFGSGVLGMVGITRRLNLA